MPAANHAPVRTRAALVPMSLLLAFMAAILCPRSGAAEAADESARQWLDRMGAYYEQHPTLKETPGSGWKPYNRVKWFLEDRMTDGELPPAGALWQAWQAKLQREREGGEGPRTSWFCTGPTRLSGRILDIEFDPSNTEVVYIGSASGGLWKSTDGGLTYATTTDGLPVLAAGAVAVLPWNSDIVLLGTGEGNGAGVWGVGLLKSTDAGATWSQTSLDYLVTNQHGFNAIEVNPVTHTILAATRDGLWRSTDEGDSWTRVATGRWYDVKWKPGDPLRVYAGRGTNGADDGVKLSVDDGLTFAQAGVGQPDPTMISQVKIAVSPANPQVVYANYVNRLTSETLGLYRSDDGGATWTAQNTGLNMTGGQGWYNLTLAADPSDPDRILAGGVHLYASDDAGVTLTITGGGAVLGDSTNVHVDHHAIAYKPGSDSEVWVGSDGGVWRSPDDGRSWMSRRSGLVTYQFYDIAVAQTNPVFMMGGTQDNGIPSRTGPTTWFPSTLIADGMVCNVTPNNASVVYGEWQNGNHVKSFNGGVNWFTMMNGITGNGAWVAPVDQDQNRPNILFTSTTAGIFRTVNGASLWDNVASHMAIWISVSMANSDIVWSVYSPGAMLSTDGGDSWHMTAVWTFPRGAVKKILAHPTDEATAFATFASYVEGHTRVVRTTDYGAHWVNVTGDLPALPVNAIAVDPESPESWYIGTDVGVWWSVDGGAHWMPYGRDLPNVVVDDLEINRAARKLVAGTYGRGAWEINLGDLTAADDRPLSVATRNLMLDPPYPNPISDRATLRFAAKGAAGATLDVYDVSGRLVDHVANALGDGIVRTVEWSPRELAGGTYFAVLRSGEERVSQKLVIQR